MAFSPSGVITGTAQTGLTSPTYTVIPGQAPTPQGKQFYVSALGGTQTGVEIHSGSNPFVSNFVVPASFRAVQFVDANGAARSVGYNVFKLIVLKGVVVDNIGNRRVLFIEQNIKVPPGADVYDPESVRAAMSFTGGLLSNQSAGIGDSLITGNG